MSAEARSVLDDIKRKSHRKSERAKIQQVEAEIVAARVRRTDSKQVQEYIKKQKNERKKQMEMEREEKKKLQELKLKQLQVTIYSIFT